MLGSLWFAFEISIKLAQFAVVRHVAVVGRHKCHFKTADVRRYRNHTRRCVSHMTFSPGIPYVPASATGAKAIIVFDEKMSKAPLEQQNKSYPWRVVRCCVTVGSVRVVCFSYQDWSGEKQGHPKLPGWKLQHGRWKNPMMIGFPIRNELSIS